MSMTTSTAKTGVLLRGCTIEKNEGKACCFAMPYIILEAPIIIKRQVLVVENNAI